jgi:hypothetical protein
MAYLSWEVALIANYTSDEILSRKRFAHWLRKTYASQDGKREKVVSALCAMTR